MNKKKKYVITILIMIITFISNTICQIDTQFIRIINFKYNKVHSWDLLNSIKHFKNKPLSKGLIQNISNLIIKRHKNIGYLEAKASCDSSWCENIKYVDLLFTVDIGDEFRINKINFHGNNSINDSKLKRRFKTKEKWLFFRGHFNLNKLKENLDSLIYYYKNIGYAFAKINSDSISYDFKNKCIFIDIYMSEGKCYSVGEITFSGNELLKEEILRPLFLFDYGTRFNQYRFNNGKDSIFTLYKNDGYLFVKVNEQIKRRKDTIDIKFEISEGQKQSLRKLIIEGNWITKEKVIRREMLLIPGDVFNFSLLLKSIEKLKGLFYFETIKYEINDNENGTVDLILTAIDKVPIS